MTAEGPAVDPVRAALLGKCPRCGKGRLFSGLIAFAPKCLNCGLDFSAFNVGDGAAPFIILVVGAIVVGLSMWLELSREPPWWVHVMLWLPLTLILTLALLREAKGLLLGRWSIGAGSGETHLHLHHHRPRAGDVCCADLAGHMAVAPP